METDSIEATPPHHPTFDVHLSENEIRTIIAAAMPNAQLINSEPLARGLSFNNRIYMIEIDHNNSIQQLVLKVCGRFWGAEKVQNEICAHLIVSHYCPRIPIPNIVAWSEDGLNCSYLRTDQIEIRAINHNQTRPWILMSRASGRKITHADIRGIHRTTLMKEIAQHVADWRLNIPPADAIGNLRFGHGKDFVPYATISGVDISVAGLLFCVKQPTVPIRTVLSFYQYKTNDQIDRIDTSQIYHGRSTVMKPLAERLVNVTQNLPAFQANATCFTHYDISPNNILINDDEEIKVSAILDFEFSGFYPVEEDFTNLMVNNPEWWPQPAWDDLLDELKKRGVELPPMDQACMVGRIREHIAPWWLNQQHDLDKEIEKSEILFREGLEWLELRQQCLTKIGHDSQKTFL